MKKRSFLLRALEKRMMLDASLPVIAGQILWLDADDTSTVLDAEGDNAAAGAAFSGSVQTWQDKSTSGFNVTAAATGNRPTYTTNIAGLNNNNALTFDGGSDWLSNAGAVVAGDDYTMFVVFNRTTAAGRDAVFELGNGGSRNALFLNDGSGANKINFYHNGTFYNPSSTYTTSSYALSTATVNTNAYTLTQNGASVGSGTAGSNRVATTGIYVGNDSSGGDELQGNIAEILVYDRDLTADERHDIETYLASKWGMTITNAAPTVATNTGATLDEGDITTVTAAMLNTTDTDNTDSTLIYTLTDATDHGTLFRDADSDGVIDAGEELLVSETFTQADINSGYLKYLHDDTDTTSDAFSFTVTDQLAVTTVANFNFTINPVLDLPVTSGAILWLDADDAATILDADGDAADSGSFNNGVQTWVNKVTPGTYNAVQTTLADRPDYTASGINNMGSIAFDASNTEFLNLGNLSALTAGDIFVVLRATQDVPGSPQNTGFMGFGTNSNNTHYAWTDGFVYDDFGSTTRYNIGNLPTNLTQAHTYNVSSETNSWIARQNGNVHYASGTNTVSFITTAQLGRSDSNSYTFNGQIAEVILFDHVLSAGDRTLVQDYLNTKWLGNAAPTLAAAGPFAFNENIAASTSVTTMAGADTDAWQTLTYSLQSGNTGGMFTIDANTGAITFAGSPDYEATSSYNLVVRVTDNGTGNLYAERTVTINISDLNESPLIATNTGATMNEGASLVITSAMLNEGDPDDSGAGLTYTASSLVNGHIEVNGVTQNTFTQADVNAGLVEFVHNGGENLLAGFDISLADGGENGSTPATGTFSITVTPVNDAPVIDGWNLISSEDFEAGATGWSNNLTTPGGIYFNRYLGEFAGGGTQAVFKTYALSTNQEYTVIEFDFLRLDSWDNEQFRIWINDTQVFGQAFTTGATTIADGTSGSVSWTVTELTQITGNLIGGNASWTDQMFRFTMTVQNSGAASVKLGFGSTNDQAIADEGWGIDNVKIYEADDGATPGPFTLAENTANAQVVGRITAGDVEGNAITYSITGGTGAAHFAINPTTGAITVTNSAALDYESVTSFTLQITATDNGTPNLSDVETITINLVDVPENTAPVITAAGPFSVAENAANGTVIHNMAATDAQGNAITWSITAGNTDNIFSITAGGQLRMNSNTNLNFEWDNQYVLTVRATDNGFGTLFSQTNITINVTDINEAPTFDTSAALLAANPYLRYNATTGNYYQYVSTAATYAAATTAANAATLHGVAGHLATVTSGAENTYVRGLSTAQMWLGGSDTTTEGTWIWAGSGTEGGLSFWLGGSGGAVQNGLYANWNGTNPDNSGGGVGEDFIVMLTGAGQWNDAVGTGTNTYVIEWEGAAVQAALAALQNGPYTVDENSAAGASAGFLEAFDIDAGDTKTYSETGGSGAALFDVNAGTGEITLATGAVLDFETSSTYTLDVRVQDAGGLFATRTVTINVNDLNEAPTALNLSHAGVDENSASGTVIGTLSSVDEDLPGDTFTYSIINDPDNKFAILGNQLRVNGALDFESFTSHSVTVRTNDGAGGTFDRIFTITVNNLNEAPALLTNTGANVEEGRSVIIRNTLLNAADQDDAPAGLTYSVSNPINGWITVGGVVQTSFTQADIDNNLVRFMHDGSETLTASFDFDLADGGEDGAASTAGTFTLNVAEDFDPAIANALFHTAENSPAAEIVGQIAFSDTEDLNGDLALSIVSGNEDGYFTLAGDGTILVAEGARLDFESVRTYSLVVQVMDTIGQTAQALITIDLLDVAENEGTLPPPPADPQAPSRSDSPLALSGFEGGISEILRDTLQNSRDPGVNDIIRSSLLGTLNSGRLDEIVRRNVLGELDVLRQGLLGEENGEGNSSLIADIITDAEIEFEQTQSQTANNTPADVIEFLNLIGETESTPQDVQGVQEDVHDAEEIEATPAPSRAPTLMEAAQEAAETFAHDVEAFLGSL